MLYFPFAFSSILYDGDSSDKLCANAIRRELYFCFARKKTCFRSFLCWNNRRHEVLFNIVFSVDRNYAHIERSHFVYRILDFFLFLARLLLSEYDSSVRLCHGQERLRPWLIKKKEREKRATRWKQWNSSNHNYFVWSHRSMILQHDIACKCDWIGFNLHHRFRAIRVHEIWAKITKILHQSFTWSTLSSDSDTIALRRSRWTKERTKNWARNRPTINRVKLCVNSFHFEMHIDTKNSGGGRRRRRLNHFMSRGRRAAIRLLIKCNALWSTSVHFKCFFLFFRKQHYLWGACAQRQTTLFSMPLKFKTRPAQQF